MALATHKKSNAIIRILDHQNIAIASLFSKDAEHAVIGSVLHEPDNYFRLADIIQASDFSELMCAYIWHGFTELAAQGREIDYLTVSETVPTLPGFKLTVDDVMMACANMMTAVPRIEHVVDYAHRVADSAQRLRIIKAADDIKKTAMDKTVTLDDVIRETDMLSFESTRRRDSKPTDMQSLVSVYYDDIEAGMQGKMVQLVPSGFRGMDEITNGYHKGQVHIVAGGAGMGKSTWLLSQIMSMAKRIKKFNDENGTQLRIVHFTMEMQARECIEKWVMQETGIAQWKLQRPAKMTPEERQLFTNAIGVIAEMPIEIIDEYGSLRPVDMRTRIKRLSQEYDVCMVTVDGLWLMEHDSVPNHNKLQSDQIIHHYLTMRITEIAKAFDVPIIMLHQYNQDAKNRKNKRPVLSDMKWGQAVQQDFHTIWGMHRLRGADADDSQGDNTVTFYGLKGRSNTNIEGNSFQLAFEPHRALYRDLTLQEVHQLK